VRRFPARRLAGGEGKVGENGEGLECYLWVAVARRERVVGGGSAERGGRRRFWSGAVALWRRWVRVAGPGSFLGMS